VEFGMEEILEAKPTFDRITLTGETKETILTRIDMTEEYLFGEEVVLRVCSALEPEISFNPQLLILKDERDSAIATTSPIFAGERISVHSAKGDPIVYSDRSAVRLPSGRMVVVPFAVEKTRLIRVWLEQHLQLDCLELNAIGPYMNSARRVQLAKPTENEILCIHIGLVERSTWVRVESGQDVFRSTVLQMACAQLSLNLEEQCLVYSDGLIVRDEQIKFFSKYKAQPLLHQKTFLHKEDSDEPTFQLKVAWQKEWLTVGMKHPIGEPYSDAMIKVCNAYGLNPRKFMFRSVFSSGTVMRIYPNDRVLLIEM
jgi:hypothetical protein